MESPCQNYKIRQFTFLLSNQCSAGQPQGWKDKKFEQDKIKCKISFRFVQHFDLCTISVHTLNTIECSLTVSLFPCLLARIYNVVCKVNKYFIVCLCICICARARKGILFFARLGGHCGQLNNEE